jgi:hypothetical protein
MQVSRRPVSGIDMRGGLTCAAAARDATTLFASKTFVGTVNKVLDSATMTRLKDTATCVIEKNFQPSPCLLKTV